MLTDDYRTTREFWDHAVASAPDRLAAVCLERRLTYREADAECAALAAGLQRATGQVSPTIAVCEKGRLIANEVKTTTSPPSGPMMYAARSIIANEKSSFKNDTGGTTGKSSRDIPNATAAKTAVKAILLAVK